MLLLHNGRTEPGQMGRLSGVVPPAQKLPFVWQASANDVQPAKLQRNKITNCRIAKHSSGTKVCPAAVGYNSNIVDACLTSAGWYYSRLSAPDSES